MTLTDTNTEALEAMVAHHAALADGVDRRVNGLRAVVERRDDHGAAVAELVAYLAEEVLPHATAEERTLYAAAATKATVAETVAGMVDEHRRLSLLAERLATADGGIEATATAEVIGALFATHVTKENELILPVLAGDEVVDLAGLLAEMQQIVEGSHGEVFASEAPTVSDVEAAMVGLVLGAAGQLADAGRGDAACKLAAEVWATLRVSRPDLAVRVTATLHRLVRAVTAEPITLSLKQRVVSGDDVVLDVRALAPAQRHETIFTTYLALGPGTAFILLNDHDPKPLRYQFEAEHKGHFVWEVLEAGPTVWRVRIGRPAYELENSDLPTGVEAELDVRPFPHRQRHDVIFAAFDALTEGTGFVLVNDHDPKPLRYQFEAQYAGGYGWEYVETGPELWRVRILRRTGQPA